MSKHTPGPWTVEPPSEQTPHIWVNAATNSGVAKIEACDYDDGKGERLTDEDFANARLIEAAPDLLRLAFQYRDDLRHPPSPDSSERRLAAIEAIIAKAEPRS
ncbi:hypothetical protein GOL88_24210 [Sinorhizobium medicae]|nr:hypothetical protein [Sinorhizobium medicae]MDX1230618.1 hypothetical protein [Sinorhizobium medicae]